MANKGKTWLVTGGSQGMGLVLTKQLLAERYNVAVTGRNIDALKKAVVQWPQVFYRWKLIW